MRIELDATEEKLVSATFDIIQKEGFKSATTKRIAKEAGVNEVTVFRKFENKNNLLKVTQCYYLQTFIDKMEEVFDFTGDEEIEEYLEKNFNELMSLSDKDFSIIKVAMEEVGDISEKKHLILRITDTILDKFEAYFKIQVDKGVIRDVDARVLGTMCFSMAFQSIVLARIYHHVTDMDRENFAKSYLDILFNGIKK